MAPGLAPKLAGPERATGPRARRASSPSAPPPAPTTTASTAARRGDPPRLKPAGAQQRLLVPAAVGAGRDQRGGQQRGQHRAGQPEEQEQHLRVRGVPAGGVQGRAEVVADHTGAGQVRLEVVRGADDRARRRRPGRPGGGRRGRRASAWSPPPWPAAAAWPTDEAKVASGSTITLSGGADGCDCGGAPTFWKRESACGRSTTPATLTVTSRVPGPADRDHVPGPDVQVGGRLLGDQDAGCGTRSAGGSHRGRWCGRSGQAEDDAGSGGLGACRRRWRGSRTCWRSAPLRGAVTPTARLTVAATGGLRAGLDLDLPVHGDRAQGSGGHGGLGRRSGTPQEPR